MSNAHHINKSGKNSFHCTHGFAISKKGSPEYKFYYTWCRMKQRCANKKNKKYGGAGIRVCKRWLKFENFMEDMADSFFNIIKSNPKITIDRINISRGYSTKNCRWASYSEQNINRRFNVKIKYLGKTKRIYEWWKILCKDIPYRILRKRVFDKGWDFDRAVKQSVRKYV